MPSYDYECLWCGSVCEQVHGINEVPDLACTCGGTKRKVIISAPAYRTNFAVGVTKTYKEYYGAENMTKASTILDK